MNEPLVSISINLLVILRLFGGLFWGFIWAAFLQFHKWGKVWVEERTWLTVLIGVGVDFIIAYPENWYITLGVVATSSVGILIRSWHNEVNPDWRKRIMPNKSLWSLMAADTAAMDISELLGRALKTESIPQTALINISAAMAKTHKIRTRIRDARNGEYYEQSK